MLTINIKGDLRPLQKAFVDFHAKQVPFAMALAFTKLAKGVQAIEDKETAEIFDSPTKFTQSAFAIKPATKSRPVAIVFPKDIQSHYLAPYVVGGDRSLWSNKGDKRGMLVPVGAGVNAYGNLTKDALARLKGKPNVFIGAVQTKRGTVRGVWQRTPTPSVNARRRRKKGASTPASTPAPGHLKLLIRFADTTPVPKRFPFYEQAQDYLRKNAAKEFGAAMKKALATAKR